MFMALYHRVNVTLTVSLQIPHNSCRRAPVAQLDRVTGFEPVGRGFESLRARHLMKNPTLRVGFFIKLAVLGIRTPRGSTKRQESLGYSRQFKKCPSPLAGEGGRRPDEG